MAFGKKKKEKIKQRKAVIRYNKQNNPLYPDKVENDVKAVVMSVGTVIVSVVLVGVIFMNFSYAVHSEKLQENTPIDSSEEGQNAQSGAVSNVVGVPAEEAEAQTEEPVDPPESAAEYVLPESNIRKLTKKDVKGLTKEQLRYARNEIYARHGRMFQDEALQQYFNSKSWYQGTIAPEYFNEAVLSQIEKDNIDLIKKYE